MTDHDKDQWPWVKTYHYRGFLMMRTFFRYGENKAQGADSRKRFQGYECKNWTTGELINVLGSFSEAKLSLDKILDEKQGAS